VEIYRCYLCVNVKVMLPQEGEIMCSLRLPVTFFLAWTR
jgi:hypothetical protein